MMNDGLLATDPEAKFPLQLRCEVNPPGAFPPHFIEIVRPVVSRSGGRGIVVWEFHAWLEERDRKAKKS